MVAKEKDIIKKVGSDLRELEDRFKKDPLKMQRLLIPIFAVKEQLYDLKPFLKGLSVPVQNFVYLLQRYKKLKLFFAIVEAYEKRMQEFLGFIPVKVWTAIPLKEKEKNKIKQKLEGLVKKEVFLSIEEKPSLLGGFQVHIGSILIDCTLLNRLGVLYQKIKGEK